MKRIKAGRCAARLAPLVLLGPLLLGGCVNSGLSYAPQTQDARMQARLWPEVQSGRVVVQAVPTGTQVSIPDQQLFAPGSARLTANGGRLLTYVVQALLEPTLLTIQVSDASDGPQGARTQAILDYFRNHQLGGQAVSALPPEGQPAAVPVGAAGTPVQGTIITVNVASG